MGKGNTKWKEVSTTISSCQYRKSDCEDETVMRSSYLHISHTGKMTYSLYPSHNKVVGGYIVFTLSVHPSVSPTSHGRSVAPTVLVDPFHIYTSYQALSESVPHAKFLEKFKDLNFWRFLKIFNFDFVLFWLGISCESLVWVIMWRRVVSQKAGLLVVLVLNQPPDQRTNMILIIPQCKYKQV